MLLIRPTLVYTSILRGDEHGIGLPSRFVCKDLFSITWDIGLLKYDMSLIRPDRKVTSSCPYSVERKTGTFQRPLIKLLDCDVDKLHILYSVEFRRNWRAMPWLDQSIASCRWLSCAKSIYFYIVGIKLSRSLSVCDFHVGLLHILPCNPISYGSAAPGCLPVCRNVSSAQ